MTVTVGQVFTAYNAQCWYDSSTWMFKVAKATKLYPTTVHSGIFPPTNFIFPPTKAGNEPLRHRTVLQSSTPQVLLRRCEDTVNYAMSL
jgi:hypothetical protein